MNTFRRISQHFWSIRLNNAAWFFQKHGIYPSQANHKLRRREYLRMKRAEITHGWAKNRAEAEYKDLFGEDPDPGIVHLWKRIIENQ